MPSSTACACRWFSRTDQYEPLSILHFRKVFRRRHFASCPRSKTSEDSLEYMMSIVPPKWLLSHTIRIGFSLRMRAVNNSFSIAPIVFGVSRVIDRRTSPAFQLLENFESDHLRYSSARRDFYSITVPGPETVVMLEGSLRDLFNGGLSSPADEDTTGNTVLYVWPVYFICKKALAY